MESARARAEDLSLQHRARGASQFRLSNVMAQYMEDIENEVRFMQRAGGEGCLGVLWKLQLHAGGGNGGCLGALS